MANTEITLTLDADLLAQIDRIATARNSNRSELIAMACREFVRQLVYINSGLVEKAAPHAVDVSPAAAALWEASWIDSPIDPAAAE